MAYRYGFKRQRKIPMGTIGVVIKELRRQSHQESEDRRNAPGARGDAHPSATPSLRVSGSVTDNAPEWVKLSQKMNYVDRSDVLRNAIHGDSSQFGTLIPQNDEFVGGKLVSDAQPEGGAPIL